MVVYSPLTPQPHQPQPQPHHHVLSHHHCLPVPVADHVKQNCNKKCKKVFSPVCGVMGRRTTTFLNSCLLEAASCLSQKPFSLVAEGPCQLEEGEAQEAAERAVAKLQDAFPNGRRWALRELEGAEREEGGGVRVMLRLQETGCATTARMGVACPLRRSGGAGRRCEATVVQGGGVRGARCEAGEVSVCEGCGEEEVELGQYAVRELTSSYSGDNQWALQNIAGATRKVLHSENVINLMKLSCSVTGLSLLQVVPGRYVEHQLQLHMTESTCAR